MILESIWFVFVIGSLASFRMAVFISQDTGPAKMFQKFRSFLKREAKQHPALRKSDVHKGVECLRCSSVWVAVPVAAYFASGWQSPFIDALLLCFSFSSVAILLNRAFRNT